MCHLIRPEQIALLLCKLGVDGFLVMFQRVRILQILAAQITHVTQVPSQTRFAMFQNARPSSAGNAIANVITTHFAH